jgi:iron complex outermembrane receptor protein
MALSVRLLYAAALLSPLIFSGISRAQVPDNAVRLPEVPITASRLGDGITGASTTIITADEIARSPATTLQDILGRQPGVQTRDLFGSVGGAQQSVDMRGFGAASTANSLILVNGRRLNDVNLGGVDFTAIPRDSIERIEITRGNSPAVLYGDGAVGGVINIITKTGYGLPSSYGADFGAGSYGMREERASATHSFGPASVSVYGNVMDSDGYRRNNVLRQRNIVGDVQYTLDRGSLYANITADQQHLGLPGARHVQPLATAFSSTANEMSTNRRGATTPYDWAEKTGINLTAGGTRLLGDGVDLALDAGIRRKDQEGSFPSSPSGVETTLVGLSLTPRLNIDHKFFGLPAKSITGVDVYQSNYQSDRSNALDNRPIHHYDADQLTLGGYGQETISVRSDTDLSGGLRIESAKTTAGDLVDRSAPGGSAAGVVQGKSLDQRQTDYAAHLGAEHRLTEALALFGRVGRSLRLPTIDERIGSAPFNVAPTFDLRAQTSHDAEAGTRFHAGRLDLQASIYRMELKNELHFNPANFTNINLDPTERKGMETSGKYALSDTLRVRGGVTFTHATFREGQFSGHEVPLVSRWTGVTGMGWDVVPKLVLLDVDVNYVGSRRMDNDQVNFQPVIPAHTLVDVQVGGAYEQFRWSLMVQNLFDQNYFDYSIASTSVPGTYNAYPLPGRTVMARVGLKF